MHRRFETAPPEPSEPERWLRGTPPPEPNPEQEEALRASLQGDHGDETNQGDEPKPTVGTAPGGVRSEWPVGPVIETWLRGELQRVHQLPSGWVRHF